MDDQKSTDAPDNKAKGVNPNPVVQEETRVFYVLVIVFVCFLIGSLIFIKALSEPRRRIIIPLSSFICFFSIDAIYRHWTELETSYGMRPLEIAFFRILLITVIAKMTDSRMLTSLAPNDRATAQPADAKTNAFAAWCLWFPLIGLLWSFEECLSTFPESFIGLGVTYIVLCFKSRGVGSRLTLLFTAMSIASILMAKTGSVSLRSAFAGACRVLRILATDFVVSQHGPLSPFSLVWGPGLVAVPISFFMFAIFEFFSASHVRMPERGLLDFTSAAVLGSFFTLASMMSMFEIMSSSSMFSLQASTVFVELMVFCILTPLSGLPLNYRLDLGLNITGFVLCLMSCMVLLKSDPFASTNMMGNALFKFLDEEEEQLEKENVSVEEIGEDEWLLTLRNKTKKDDSNNQS